MMNTYNTRISQFPEILPAIFMRLKPRGAVQGLGQTASRSVCGSRSRVDRNSIGNLVEAVRTTSSANVRFQLRAAFLNSSPAL